MVWYYSKRFMFLFDVCTSKNQQQQQPLYVEPTLLAWAIQWTTCNITKKKRSIWIFIIENGDCKNWNKPFFIVWYFAKQRYLQKLKCVNTSCAQSIYECLYDCASRFTCAIIVYNKWILLGITHTIIAIYIFLNFLSFYRSISLSCGISSRFFCSPYTFSSSLIVLMMMITTTTTTMKEEEKRAVEKREEKTNTTRSQRISVYFTFRSWVFYMENPVNIHLFSFKISFCVPVVYS